MRLPENLLHIPLARISVAGGTALTRLLAIAVVGILLTISFTPSTANALGTGPADIDRAALVALYNATDGPNWNNNTNWLTDAPISEWYGVTTRSWDGRVSSLALSNNNLTGQIPPELGSLDRLRNLNLADNELTGPIPSELGILQYLTVLNLAGNELAGPIPSELGNLPYLTELYLRDNQLAGTIPPELGNLATLRELGLSGNELTGPIPPELGNLATLRELGLSGNELTGPIPPKLGEFFRLVSLNLASNQLTGTIPPELGNLSFLSSLNLSGNQLTGCIPNALRDVFRSPDAINRPDLPFCAAAPAPDIYIQLAISGLHTCALRTDSTVACWGNDEYGQVSRAPSDDRFRLIAAGPQHNCGIHMGGSIVCWGRSDYSQSTLPSGWYWLPPGGFMFMGVGPPKVGPPGPETDRYTQLVTGELHVCALRTDSTVVCWGNDEYGQVSNAPSDRFRLIAAGPHHNCGIRQDGTVACWGRDDYRQSADGSFASTN